MLDTGNNNRGLKLRIAGLLENFDPKNILSDCKYDWMDRFAHIAVAAGKLALDDAGIDLNGEDRRKIGVVFGSSLGGMHVAEEQLEILFTKGPKRIRPKLIPANTLNSAAAEIAITFGLKGPNLTVTASDVSSSAAIGLAYDAFQIYDLDIVIAGGTDAPFSPLTVKSLLGKRLISSSASRPFDLDRDGFVLSEGGALLILENFEHAQRRAANVYAEYGGYGLCRINPRMNGQPLTHAARMALQCSSVPIEAVDYIQAHGSATRQGDEIEARGICQLLGDRFLQVPVSAAKSMLGHTLGGAGAIDIAVCALTIRDGTLVPTINHVTRDPRCNLNLVCKHTQARPVNCALINAISLNGDSMVTVLKNSGGQAGLTPFVSC